MSYLAWMLAGTLGAALLAVAATAAVDPYRAFGTPPVPGWTLHKPRIFQHAAAAKRWQIARVRPRSLLLGSSRVEAGIDPRSPLWPAAARPVFNAGLAGRRLDSAVDMLRAAVAAGRLQDVYVGLDFVDFLPIADPPSLPGGEAKPPDRWRELRDLARATLTFDALVDTASTLFGQGSAATDMTSEGFNPMREYDADTRRFGFRRLFDQKEAALRSQLRRLRPRDFDETRTGEFAALRQLLAEAGRAGLRPTLFIHPHHANYLEELRRQGFWDCFEAWKRALAALLDDAPPGTRLIDFSGYDEATAEPVPLHGDVRTRMRYHWEVGHYSAGMGERVIAGLLGPGEAGRALRPDTVEAALEAAREGRGRFMAAQEESAAARARAGDEGDARRHGGR